MGNCIKLNGKYSLENIYKISQGTKGQAGWAKSRFPSICRLSPHYHTWLSYQSRGKSICTTLVTQNLTWQIRKMCCGKPGGGEGKRLNILATNAFDPILMAAYTIAFKTQWWDECRQDMSDISCVEQYFPDCEIPSNHMPQTQLSLDCPFLIRQEW